jgi:ABC-2 type transport system ATP-binding protein
VSGALKVRELIDLFRSYYPHPMPAARALAMAGLEEQAAVLSAKLSGGQRQRLYYALAVCGDPELLFLDEPTVGLDVEARRRFLAGIREFAQAGRTVLLTTHYLDEADELAGRIVVVDHGVVIADATPREIKSRVAGKRIIFTSDHEVAASELAGLPLSSLEISGPRVRILSNEPEAVLREVFRRGLEVHDLEVAGADLEEAFITLTSRPGQELAAP